MLAPEMHEFKISLENYYGPLDLLLHLARQNELDVLEIPLSKVVDDYIYFIDTLKSMDINIAGDFFSLASQLLLMKSRKILPSQESEEGEEESLSFGLIKQLLEYKKYRDFSQRIGELIERRSDMYARPVQTEQLVELKNISAFEIGSCFVRLTRQIQFKSRLDIIYQDTPIEKFIHLILELVSRKKNITFEEIIANSPVNKKLFTIGALLALLELVRQEKVTIDQEESGNILISAF